MSGHGEDVNRRTVLKRMTKTGAVFGLSAAATGAASASLSADDGSNGPPEAADPETGASLGSAGDELADVGDCFYSAEVEFECGCEEEKISPGGPFWDAEWESTWHATYTVYKCYQTPTGYGPSCTVHEEHDCHHYTETFNKRCDEVTDEELRERARELEEENEAEMEDWSC